MFYVIGFFAALILSTGLTWKIRNVAMAHAWIALPRSARHVHKTGIPRLGGIAVLATFLVVGATTVFVAHQVAPQLQFSGHVLLFVLLAAAEWDASSVALQTWRASSGHQFVVFRISARALPRLPRYMRRNAARRGDSAEKNGGGGFVRLNNTAGEGARATPPYGVPFFL